MQRYLIKNILKIKATPRIQTKNTIKPNQLRFRAT